MMDAGQKRETFTRWQVATHLNSEEAIAAYLTACAEDNDPQLMAAALVDVAVARARLPAR